MTSVRLAGLGLAAVGVSHFVRPQLYTGLTAAIFPTDVSRHVLIDGAVETALGVGLMHPATRRVAVVAGLGYLVYLGANAVRRS